VRSAIDFDEGFLFLELSRSAKERLMKTNGLTKKSKLPPLDERDWFTEREAAREIGVETSTLRKWRAEGTSPEWYRAGRLVRYKKQAVRDWIRKHSRGGQEPGQAA
jgi:excisionase family DNA binding protein